MLCLATWGTLRMDTVMQLLKSTCCKSQFIKYVTYVFCMFYAHNKNNMYVCMDHAWMFDDVCMDVCIPWLGRFQWLQCTDHSCIKNFKGLYNISIHIYRLIERERGLIGSNRSTDDISSGIARSSLAEPLHNPPRPWVTEPTNTFLWQPPQSPPPPPNRWAAKLCEAMRSFDVGKCEKNPGKLFELATNQDTCIYSYIRYIYIIIIMIIIMYIYIYVCMYIYIYMCVCVIHCYPMIMLYLFPCSPIYSWLISAVATAPSAFPGTVDALKARPRTYRKQHRGRIIRAVACSDPRKSMDWFKGKFTGKPHI